MFRFTITLTSWFTMGKSHEGGGIQKIGWLDSARLPFANPLFCNSPPMRLHLALKTHMYQSYTHKILSYVLSSLKQEAQISSHMTILPNLPTSILSLSPLFWECPPSAPPLWLYWCWKGKSKYIYNICPLGKNQVSVNHLHLPCQFFWKNQLCFDNFI